MIIELELNNSQVNWVAEHLQESLEVYDYVAKEHGWSDVAKAFAKEAIEALRNSTFSTLIQDYRPRMSTSEIVTFDDMNVVDQFIYLLNGQKATWKAEALFPNSLYNGPGDAFRHAYFNGLNAILLGISLSEDLATAHEDKPAPPGYINHFKEKQMDLFNNEVGRTKKYWFSDGYGSLTESILDAMSNGKLRYLSNLLGGGSSGPATNLSQLTTTN